MTIKDAYATAIKSQKLVSDEGRNVSWKNWKSFSKTYLLTGG